MSTKAGDFLTQLSLLFVSRILESLSKTLHVSLEKRELSFLVSYPSVE